VAATEGLDAAIQAGLYLCTGCGGCEPSCPASVDTRSVLRALRARALREGRAIPMAGAMLEVVKGAGNPYGVALQGLPAPGHAPTVLFVGCGERKPGWDSDVPAARRMLERLGVEHTFIDERCCQAIVELFGGERDRGMVEHNVEAIKRAGARRVVCMCPTCAHHLAIDLEGTGIEVVPLVELLATADLPVRFEGRVTYHDPCDLGRKSGRGERGYDAPRAAIRATGAELVELQHSREDARCCGGGGLLATYPTLSVAIAKERMDEVRATGAEWCLADCPNCVHNLRSALKAKDRVQVATTLRWLDSLLSQ